MLSEQEQIRRDSLQKIIDYGINPYPAAEFKVSHYSVDILENFNEGNVIRTSISKINCFVFCRKKDETYYIICPVSFSNAMRSRLIQLIELS